MYHTAIKFTPFFQPYFTNGEFRIVVYNRNSKSHTANENAIYMSMNVILQVLPGEVRNAPSSVKVVALKKVNDI